METRFKLRLYQEKLFAKAVESNLLCVLPTGLGKTMVALALSVYILRKNSGKILILAPTKPLCIQHERTFRENLVLDSEEDIALLTGAVNKEKRKELWNKSKIIFATGQTIESDLLSGRLNLKNVSLVVFDEAHRAVGDYCYTFLAKQYMKQSENQRILALTASPGTNREEIDSIRNNLFIDSIEIMDESDELVKPYVKKKTIHRIDIEFPQELNKIKKNLEESLRTYLKILKEKEIVESADISKIRKSQLLQLQGKLGKMASSGEMVYSELSTAAVCVKIMHSVEILQTQGIQSLKEYFKKIRRNQRVKANRTLLSDLHFNRAIVFSDETTVEHPKQEKLYEILKNELGPGNKAIIFSHYRDNAKHLLNNMKKIDGITPTLFVGQSGKEGMTQKMQRQVIEEFSSGKYNALIATSIGEEGIDIPKIDVAVFYEPVPSALRSIQRRGRVGRTEIGKVFILVTKNTIDEAYYWIAQRKERNMKETLRSMKHEMDFGKQTKMGDFSG